MDSELDKRISFLAAAHIGAREHSTRGLLDHLLGTRQLLLEWGARAALCDAGLFHPVYGTEHHLPGTIPFTLRDQVTNLIGTETAPCLRAQRAFAQAGGKAWQFWR